MYKYNIKNNEDKFMLNCTERLLIMTGEILSGKTIYI